MALFKRKSILSYDRSFYQFADTARQIPNPRAEYRKLRNVALNRIRKLERAGYGDTETVRKARRTFEDLPRDLTQDEAAQHLPEAARFIESARGTVGGMREIERKTVQTLQDRGYDFITNRNVRAFTEFLDWLGQEKALFIPYMAEALAPREGGAERKPVSIEIIQESFEQWARENDYKSK